MKNIILTGYQSGLGKFLSKNFDDPYNLGYHNDFSELKHADTSDSVLIHCGFSRIVPKENISLTSYKKNVISTQRLLQYRFKKVIYISTVDVYPKNSDECKEDEQLTNESAPGIYAYQKLIAEEITKASSDSYLILRLPMLVGIDVRTNSIQRLINGTKISLSGTSTVNVVTHALVLKFIQQAIRAKATGVFNLTAKTNATLSDLKIALKSKSNFGDFDYKTPNLNNSKAQKILPELANSSESIVKAFSLEVFKHMKNSKK